MILGPGLGVRHGSERWKVEIPGSGSVEAGLEAHSQNQSPVKFKMSPIHVVHGDGIISFSPLGPAILSFRVGRQSHGYSPNQ